MIEYLSKLKESSKNLARLIALGAHLHLQTCCYRLNRYVNSIGASLQELSHTVIAQKIGEVGEKIDFALINFMNRWGILSIRISFATIFIWFGILKPMGISSAESLVLATIGWMPFLEASTWLGIIGWWEVAIGIGFLFQRTTRIALVLLGGQMIGTFMPLFMLRETTFQASHFPYGPTLEGQYIIKNLLIISAAMVVGATLRKKSKNPTHHATPTHPSNDSVLSEMKSKFAEKR